MQCCSSSLSSPAAYLPLMMESMSPMTMSMKVAIAALAISTISLVASAGPTAAHIIHYLLRSLTWKHTEFTRVKDDLLPLFWKPGQQHHQKSDQPHSQKLDQGCGKELNQPPGQRSDQQHKKEPAQPSKNLQEVEAQEKILRLTER